MKIRAISILAPQIHLVNAGLLTRLFRPAGGVLDALQPGDMLWVREPFVLPAEFDRFAPSQADRLGAQPIFVADVVAGIPSGRRPGRPRYARELLRAWHRQHFRITNVSRRRGRDITLQEIKAQGYVLENGFAAAWDSNLSFSKAGQTWNENPQVLAIDFERVATPVDAMLGEAA